MTRARTSISMIAATLLALPWTTHVQADGAVNIDTCQTLSSPNTTYKVTKDLTSNNFETPCLIVAADRITIDLQGHKLTGPGGGLPSGISDLDIARDLIVIKNGSISAFEDGIYLSSTRVSVLAVTANGNGGAGIYLIGAQSLVKSSEASNNSQGILAVGDRAQIQQSTANANHSTGIVAGDNCLVTMNTANENRLFQSIVAGQKCTVSYNTANNNGNVSNQIGVGILVGARSLVTRNTALNNAAADFAVACPSEVTFNDSTNGFPASYTLGGAGCKTNGNQ